MGAFAVPFTALSEKNITGDHVLFQNWYLLGVKKNFQAMPTKQDLSTC